jgi:hypothetical protein
MGLWEGKTVQGVRTMMHFSKIVKTAALAGLVGLGFTAATTTPAAAERSFVRCDRDGDRCWRVVCDGYGYDCRRYMIRTGYDNRRYYSGRYYYDRQYDRGYYESGYRRWVCDRYGNYCHWTSGRPR